MRFTEAEPVVLRVEVECAKESVPKVRLPLERVVVAFWIEFALLKIIFPVESPERVTL